MCILNFGTFLCRPLQNNGKWSNCEFFILFHRTYEFRFWIKFKRIVQVVRVGTQAADHPNCSRHRDMWSHTFTVFTRRKRPLTAWFKWSVEMLHKTQNFAPFYPECWYNVKKKWIKITYRMYLVSCSAFLWRFQSLELWHPRLIHNITARLANSAAGRGISLLNFAHFLPLPRVPRHPASRKSKPDSFWRSRPKIAEFACL